MKKTLVIFDVDGTLVYSNRIDSQCFAKTYEDIYKRPFPTIDWTHYPHVTDTVIFRTVIWQHFQREVTEGEMIVFQDQYVDLLEHSRQVKPDDFQEVPNARVAVGNLLNDDRFVVGIATGGWQKPAHVKLKHARIPFHDHLLSGADGKESREEIILHVVEEVQKHYPEVHRTVYVGDAIWDVDTTRRMGINFIGIRRMGDAAVLKAAGTSVVLKDYLDYDQFVEAIFTAMPPAEF